MAPVINTNVSFGVDECLLPGMLARADSAVGRIYNFATPIFEKVLNALKESNLSCAQDAQLAATRLIRAILKYSAQPAIKSVMRLAGIDCSPSRLPLFWSLRGAYEFKDGVRPWEGGVKQWHDTIYVLLTPKSKWEQSPVTLPRPLGYGVAISTPEGHWCIE